MLERQLDLFADAGARVEQSFPRSKGRAPAAEELADDALIAAIPRASLADALALAAEAGRRRLAGAVHALAALCRRFAGFGIERLVPEQAVAFQALAMIGGRDAARAVAEMIARSVVQGPTLNVAMSAAAQLRSTLPVNVLRPLLQHADPRIRADACRCSRPWPELITAVVDRLDDLDKSVARSAACVLGQMGRIEARPLLTSLLREAPSEEVIESVSPIADEECMVLLGRIGRLTAGLADAALDTLEGIDHPRAGMIAAANRRLVRSRGRSERPVARATTASRSGADA